MNQLLFIILYSLFITGIFSLIFVCYCLNTEKKLFILVNRNNDPKLNPIKGSKYSAGIDIHSNSENIIPALGRKLISTGLYLGEVPECIYLRVAPRSGLAVKGIDVGAGVIDRDYEGEIKVLLINSNSTDFQINQYDRIAQLIPEKYYELNPEIESLTNSDRIECKIIKKTRSSGGFGSTDTLMKGPEHPKKDM